jgi:ligand-binding SRPBCC domain-containing protein
MHNSENVSISFSDADNCFRILSASQWVPRPLEEVFDFFQRPANLGKLTPPEQKMRILEPYPETMSAGDIFIYKLKVAGIPLKWKARIDSVTPNESFQDTMIKGPYRAWIHTHRFESKDGGTVIRDEVRYKVYGCRYGHKYFYRPQLEKIFRARADAVEKYFSGND